MGPLVPAPICQSVMVWKASPLGSGRKNDFSPAEVGVGWGPRACPAHHVLRASGLRGTGGQAVRGGQEVPRGSPAGRGRNVLKRQLKVLIQGLELPTEDADPKLPSPPPQVLRGAVPTLG